MMRYTDVLRRRLGSSLALARGLYPDRPDNRQLRPEIEAARRLLALHDAARKYFDALNAEGRGTGTALSRCYAQVALKDALRRAEEECPDGL